MCLPVTLLKAYRQELIRSHLEFKDYYFALSGSAIEVGQ